MDKDLSRRERERLRQRQDMLDAALLLFSEKGYHNVSMQEIAEKAEFAIGTLYKFFQNKEDLYKTLHMELADKFHNALTKAIGEPEDEIQKLRNYVVAKGIVFQENAAVIRLYFAETRGASFNIKSGMDKALRERYKRFLLKGAHVFESGMKKGIFQQLADPYLLALALDNLCNAFLPLWLEEPEKHPYPEDPDEILNILFQGLLKS